MSNNKRRNTTIKPLDCSVFYNKLFFGDDGENVRTMVAPLRMIRADRRLLKLPKMVNLLLVASMDETIGV